MHLFPSVQEFLAQIRTQWFGATLSSGPFLTLSDEEGIDFRLVCQIIRYGALDLFQTKKLEVLADSLGRLAPAKRMDD